MKRVFSLLLAVCLCCSFLAVTATASETGTGWYNVLDYTVDEETGIGYAGFTGSQEFTYVIPEIRFYRYFDIVFTATGSKLTETNLYQLASRQEVAVTVLELGDSMYRMYNTEPLNKAGSTFVLEFVNSGSSKSYIKINQFLLGSRSAVGFGTTCRGFVSYGGAQTSEMIMDDPDTPLTINFGSQISSIPETGNYLGYFYVDDWSKYDGIEVSLLISADTVNSVSATLGLDSLPVTISYLDTSASEWKEWTAYPEEIQTELLIAPNEIVYLTVSIDLSNVDRLSPYTLCLYITGAYNNEKDASRYISIQSVQGIVAVEGQSLFASWMMRIQNALDRIYSALIGDSSSSDDFQSEVETQAGELEQAGDVMDSVTRPAVEDVDVSVDVYIDPSGVETVGDILSQFMQNQLIFSMVMISITVALASFIIYGRK